MVNPTPFDAYLAKCPRDTHAALAQARDLILETAENTVSAGRVEMTFKWGQPSFATTPKTGTPLRLGLTKSGVPALFVHCQTSLVGDLVKRPDHSLAVEGTRAVLLPSPDRQDSAALTDFIVSALLYHKTAQD